MDYPTDQDVLATLSAFMGEEEARRQLQIHAAQWVWQGDYQLLRGEMVDRFLLLLHPIGPVGEVQKLRIGGPPVWAEVPVLVGTVGDVLYVDEHEQESQNR